MTQPSVEKRARELLAAEFLADGLGINIHDLPLNQLTPAERRSIRAISTALSSSRADAWQPIETAPKDGTWILAAEDGGPDFVCDVYAASWNDDGYWLSRCGQYVTQTPEPTHWMPLLPISTPQEEA